MSEDKREPPLDDPRWARCHCKRGEVVDPACPIHGDRYSQQHFDVFCDSMDYEERLFAQCEMFDLTPAELGECLTEEQVDRYRAYVEQIRRERQK